MSKKSKHSENVKIVGFDGPPCHRCGHPTEIREHKRITEKELAKQFYYSRWFMCRNRDCKTTTITLDEFKVGKENGQAQAPQDLVAAPTDQRDSGVEGFDQMNGAGDRPPWE